ncbi:MAG: glycosyltransferase family 4 protein [Phycisphaerae bacterium]
MTTDNLGGVWTYSLELSRALGEQGVEVHLAVMGSPVTEQQLTQADRIDRLTLHAGNYRLEWADDPWGDVDRAGDWLLQLERQCAADVIHLNGYAHGSLPWRGPVLAVGHSCVLSWWEAVKGEPAPDRWAEYRRRVRDGLQAVDAVVAPTAAMLGELQRHYGPLTNTRVIPNCRRPGPFQPRWKERIVFSAGRLWDEAKNLAGLQEIAGQLSWPVFVAGEGADTTDALTWLGWLPPEKMVRWLGRSAVYAHPARYEPFGLAPLEAGLSGCALVLGDIPSLHEVWADAAVYAAPDDPQDLAAQIRRLQEDDSLRREMARRARRRALRYAPAMTAGRYMAVYRSLLSAGDGSYVSQIPAASKLHETSDSERR